MNRLLIAAFALGAFGFTQSEVSARPLSVVRLMQVDDGVIQIAADDRDQDIKDEPGDYWGRGGDRMWRDTRPWSDDEWRSDPNLDNNIPDDDND